MKFLKINDRFINCENIESIFIEETEINFYDNALPSGSYTIYVRLVSGKEVAIYSDSKIKCLSKTRSLLKNLGVRLWDIEHL